jgi:hypothetical protein
MLESVPLKGPAQCDPASQVEIGSEGVLTRRGQNEARIAFQQSRLFRDRVSEPADTRDAFCGAAADILRRTKHTNGGIIGRGVMSNGETTVNGDMLEKTMGNGEKFWDKMANNGKIFYTNASSLAMPAGTQ